MADRLTNMFKETIEAKGVRFALEMKDFDEYCLVGDETRLCQVLINFLSNAQKFTSEGEVTVTFRQMLKENGRMDFMVNVHDTGIGMKHEFLEKIFLPFEQESVNITSKYGGSGLGMAITDNIVRIMGGTIVIDSMQGKGSDFNVFLSLPLATAEESSAIPAPAAAALPEEFTYSGKHILLAEDNEINAEIAEDILTGEGAIVEIAHDGREAVDMFAESALSHYDLVLMDVQMPRLNGRQAAQEIRNLSRPDAQTVCIFALSADAFVEDKRLSIEMGMDGHFPKPVDFGAMKKEIGKAMIARSKK